MSINHVTDLPFVQSQAGTIKSYWHVPRTQSYRDDNARGREYADALLGLMVTQDNPTLLGRVIVSMMDGRQVYGAVEIGFFNRIADAAMRAPTTEV